MPGTLIGKASRNFCCCNLIPSQLQLQVSSDAWSLPSTDQAAQKGIGADFSALTLQMAFYVWGWGRHICTMTMSCDS